MSNATICIWSNKPGMVELADLLDKAIGKLAGNGADSFATEKVRVETLGKMDTEETICCLS